MRDARASAARRGYDADHRRWRDAVLDRDPICVICWRNWGRVSAATVADHITPIAVDPSLRLDLANGRGLCRECHQKITGRFRAEGINEPLEEMR